LADIYGGGYIDFRRLNLPDAREMELIAMGTIVSGTVVLWKIIGEGDKRRVENEDIRNVVAYAAGPVSNETQLLPIIVGKYITDRGLDAASTTDIWSRAGRGLLQVLRIEKTTFTPPHLT
jgi:hypothetical protein